MRITNESELMNVAKWSLTVQCLKPFQFEFQFKFNVISLIVMNKERYGQLIEPSACFLAEVTCLKCQELLFLYFVIRVFYVEARLQ